MEDLPSIAILLISLLSLSNSVRFEIQLFSHSIFQGLISKPSFSPYLSTALLIQNLDIHSFLLIPTVHHHFARIL